MFTEADMLQVNQQLNNLVFNNLQKQPTIKFT